MNWNVPDPAKYMDAPLHFACTKCGNCCHNLRLPLNLGEAANWLQRGGDVQVFCEAIPWPQEPYPDALQAEHKRMRSFLAVSGDLPIRVVVSVVAYFDDACPHLLPDMRCGAYEVRPLVCRIYPAELNPFRELVPQLKACPPQAWADEQPIFWSEGRPLDVAMARASGQFRNNDFRETPLREKLCSLLGIAHASLANEGFVVHSVEWEVMLTALSCIEGSTVGQPGLSDWEFVTNKASTRGTLLEIGARIDTGDFTSPNGTLQYLAF
ncbi:YkgJ family cysteine cluster protein [Paraburkholderia strydomiana]|uniref:YkgJ family cysteine cluster protein n=1 Tax=Paraburkholderia strydomiana TaxID=1245417 RepID=UPI0038BA3161